MTFPPNPLKNTRREKSKIRYVSRCVAQVSQLYYWKQKRELIFPPATNNLEIHMKSGDKVKTSNGEGLVILSRDDDQICAVKLPFGLLYCRTTLPAINHDSTKQKIMELNVAYEALENMRKLNLEVSFKEKGIPLKTCSERCSACLFMDHEKNKCNSPSSGLDWHCRLVGGTAAALTLKTSTIKKSPPCLLCGTPVCRKHSSAQFRRENIVLCRASCEALFGTDYVVNILTCKDVNQRRQSVDRLIELYDRAVLLLKSSALQLEGICESLQTAAVTQNRVGLGSSGAGIVSGVLGIASAATILTPVGPPLLVASLLFGGSATAATAGSAVVNSLSEGNRMADRIIALHGICWNILFVTGTLRNALMLDHLRAAADLYKNSSSDNKIMPTGCCSPIADYWNNHQSDILARAATVGSLGTVGVVTMGTFEVVTAMEGSAVMATRGARFFGRSSTAALSTLRFARIAGGALAAATLVLEAHSMKNTLQAIKAGNPCEKVDTLRNIHRQMQNLPATKEVGFECERCLETLILRQRIMTQNEVTKLLLENAEILQQAQELASRTSTDDDDTSMDSSGRSQQSASSMLERIERHKRKERFSKHRHDHCALNKDTAPITPMSLKKRIEWYKQQERPSPLNS